jgi:DNA/RNA endonuclease G (NUC1)
LVQLDQWLGGKVGDEQTGRIYDATGQLIREQGRVLNSPMHFIGFSRGTVVNSEIIQRLLTAFPHAGGVSDSDRDLQMTTIDPHDFEQPSLNNFGVISGIVPNYSDFHEPKVQVWKGITFADNYYETVPQLDGNSLTPAGRDITNSSFMLGTPDLSIQLGSSPPSNPMSRIGFTQDTDPFGVGPIEIFAGRGATHGRVLNWYRGTENLGLAESPEELYRRLSDAQYPHLFDKEFYSTNNQSFNPWYTPDYTVLNNPSTAPTPWEGIGTGWFYSVLGGGKDLRPTMNIERVPLDYDNTDENRMQGDAPVPTLFDGNFDAVFDPKGLRRQLVSGEIPGWSMHGGEVNVVGQPTFSLVDWKNIPSLSDYRDQVGYNPSQPNYALRLNSGNSITHNRFVVPDWGALRFDLHVPFPALLNDTGNVIKVILKTANGSKELVSKDLERLLQDLPDRFPSDLTVNKVAVDLREVDNRFSTNKAGGEPAYPQPQIQSQVNRIGYGSRGFETFQVDIPEDVRGQIATLTFEMNGNTVAYLDNVFFGNEVLRFGNPTLNGQKTGTNSNNYLVEKPQYVVSYNDSLKTPNWSGYRLDQSWLVKDVNAKNRPNWGNDTSLPFPIVLGKNPEDNYVDLPPRPDTPLNGSYTNGHLTARADRQRVVKSVNPITPNQSDHYFIAKDQYQTFVMTNAIPQDLKTSAWTELEGDINAYIGNSAQPREAYIFSGRAGSFGKFSTVTNGIQVDVPDSLWKVVLIPEQFGQSPSDITLGATAFGVLMTNANHNNVKNWWNSGISSVFSINEIENLTGLDFFSEIPDEIEEVIEGYKRHQPISGSASLLAESNDRFPIRMAVIEGRDNDLIPAGQNRIPEQSTISLELIQPVGVSVTSPNLGQVSSSQITVFQQGSIQINILQNSERQIRQSQVDSYHTGGTDPSVTQNGTSQVSRIQINQIQDRTPKVSSTKTSFFETDIVKSHAPKLGSTQNDSSQVSVFDDSTPCGIQLNTSKVSFPISISLQNFVNGQNEGIWRRHKYPAVDFTGSILDYWQAFDADFDINLVVQDLPPGQLAESQITSFDFSGRPLSGTLTFDTDANGLGWYIDPTPEDHTEYATALTSTAFKATPGSPAYGPG